jgi:hypothetical protein
MKYIKLSLPTSNLFTLPTFDTPIAPCPIDKEWVKQVYYWSLDPKTPITIALVYFVSVHLINNMVIKRQIKKFQNSEKKKNTNTNNNNNKNNGSIISKSNGEINIKKLPPAPLSFSLKWYFKLFVLFHNIFLCGYSIWTFVTMLDLIHLDYHQFFYNVCSNEIFLKAHYNLTYLGWLFYLSKFYEIIDTLIILIKGRPSSLLQSYHHAGAMMCMWSGIRYQAPPIWIFVLFNSFIHSLMYGYFTVSCLKITVPIIVKRVLTTLQICQFVIGGSLALFHSMLQYYNEDWIDCIQNGDQALTLIINVGYLAPLTMLFAKFYIESYLKRKII